MTPEQVQGSARNRPSGFNRQLALTRHCSFCGKSQNDVDLLVADPRDRVFICSDCIERCMVAVGSARQAREMKAAAARCAGCVPQPLEIKVPA